MSPLKIKCMIVDDEPLAIRVVSSHLDKISDIDIVATCTSAIEAYEVIQKQAIDLIFLDIQMPELTGIEFIRSLERPPKIIFTTAYRDYALEGFELDVVDYLLKPVSLPRLLRALDKYRRQSGALAPPERLSPPASPVLTFRSNRQTVRVAAEDILYIESLSDYIQVHTKTSVIVCKERISHIAEKLEPLGFLRIHRSFLVSSSKINSFSTDAVQINDVTIPISRSYKQMVRQYLTSLKADS